MSDRGSTAKIDEKRIRFGDSVDLFKGETEIRLSLHHRDFDLELDLDYGKGAFWHCDHGKLYMGMPNNKHESLPQGQAFTLYRRFRVTVGFAGIRITHRITDSPPIPGKSTLFAEHQHRKRHCDTFCYASLPVNVIIDW